MKLFTSSAALILFAMALGLGSSAQAASAQQSIVSDSLQKPVLESASFEKRMQSTRRIASSMQATLAELKAESGLAETPSLPVDIKL